ncbi:MAG: hypothetical protein ACO331_05265 [Prochlorothrix sp.]
MNRPPKVLDPEASYFFSSYSELAFDIEDILADLDCQFDRDQLHFEPFQGELARIPLLQEQIRDGIRYTTLNSEQARRQFLIAPLIREICRTTQQRVRVEYPVVVSNWLRGTLDYYFQAQNLVVIEAKRDNLSQGFTQLAIELLALDQWTDRDTPHLYGAVTTGENWRFGILYREQRRIVEDLKLYRVPEELERLMSILLGLLTPVEPTPLNTP